MTKTEKKIVRDHVLDLYDNLGAHSVLIKGNGQVLVTVDRLPNTSTPGRMFGGYAKDLLLIAMACGEPR
jgi:hypothetical protein